jgi:peroxiredoxin Q/BCP
MSIKDSIPAPDFELSDAAGKMHKLSDYRGKPVVLYFYPKDDTPGCTTEACGFRDDYGLFQAAGVVVLGVSPDAPKSHKKFAEKYQLPFTLLSDPDHAVCEKYEVWGLKKYMGREYFGVFRTTFLIDAEGKIIKVFANVKPDGHSTEILAELSK